MLLFTVHITATAILCSFDEPPAPPLLLEDIAF